MVVTSYLYNLRRRQLTDNQKFKYAKDLIEIYSELAKQKQSEAGRTFGRGKDDSLGQKNPKGFSKEEETRKDGRREGC